MTRARESRWQGWRRGEARPHTSSFLAGVAVLSGRAPAGGGGVKARGRRMCELHANGRTQKRERVQLQYVCCSVDGHHWLALRRGHGPMEGRGGREVNAPCFGMGMFEKVVKGGGCLVGKAWSGCEPQHCTHSRFAFRVSQRPWEKSGVALPCLHLHRLPLSHV
jgi:hypothetical protein